MLNELGRRFVAGGALGAAEDIYWLEEQEVQELAAALERRDPLPDCSGRIPPRKAAWQAQRRLNPPGMLPETSRWAKLVPWAKESSSRPSDGAQRLRRQRRQGHGDGPGALGPEDFAQMQPGDVLVAVTTTPAWTALFAMASAVVTDIGGPLSHSSIVAPRIRHPGRDGDRRGHAAHPQRAGDHGGWRRVASCCCRMGVRHDHGQTTQAYTISVRRAGLKADWLRNIQSNPKVEIRVGWLAAAMPPCYSKQATVSV